MPLERGNHLFVDGSADHRNVHAVCDFLDDPLPKGQLSGTRTFGERLEQKVVSTGQNELVKVRLLIGAVIGLLLSIIQIWQWLA